MIDLRSDTVTQPTPKMRSAMAEAEVGDDVYGDDPTVNRLEDLTANAAEGGFHIYVLNKNGEVVDKINPNS